MSTKRRWAVGLTALLLGMAICMPVFSAGGAEEAATEEGTVTLDAWVDGIDFAMQDGIQDDPVNQMITEKTGVILNVSSTKKFANMQEKYATALAGGTLPDILRLREQIAPQAISAGALLELDEYVENSEHIKDDTQMLEAVRLRLSTDATGEWRNKLYAVGFGIRDGSAPEPLLSFITRWDLYEELGHPEVTRWEDYLPILQDMLELEPTNDQGQKNYAFSGWWATNLWTVNVMASGLLGYQALSTKIPTGATGLEVIYDFNTGTIRNALTEPDSPYWRVVEFYNKANQMGLVDPDAPVMKQQDYVAKVDAGRVFVVFGHWHINEIAKRFAQEGEGRGYVSMPPIPTDPRPIFKYNRALYYSRPWSINADTRHPDKAFEVFDFMHSQYGTLTAWSGAEGDTWDMVNGVPTLRDEAIDGFFNDPDFKSNHGVEFYKLFSGDWRMTSLDEYGGVPGSLYAAPEIMAANLRPAEKAAAEYYDVTTLNDLFTTENARMGDDGIYFMLDFYRELANVSADDLSRMKAIGTELKAYHLNGIVQAIMAPSDEEFQAKKAEAIERFIDLGADEMYDFFADILDDIM